MFLYKLRDEMKFSGLEQLKQQIAQDIAQAREVLGASQQATAAKTVLVTA